jgi:hypothetical protein
MTILQESWDRRQMARMMRVLIFHDLEYRDGTPLDNMRDKIAKNRGNAGETCWNAKLTASQVKEIRNKTELSSTQLAKDYCVSSGLIRRIRRMEAWK